jgi:uncharacterized membrane protein YeaQ/YmgE (transglycosylase-associated protein family)
MEEVSWVLSRMSRRGKLHEIAIDIKRRSTDNLWLREPSPRREPMFGVLGWIIFGLIAGVIAKLIMPGRDPGGFVVTILLGIAGALVGGFVGRALGLYNEGEPAGLILSVIGAIILLGVYRMVVKPHPKV